MPFGITGGIAAGLADAGIGSATASIIASGLVDAGGGALLGGGLSALSGGKFGKGALLGGITGGLGGVGSGLLTDFAPDTAAALGIGGQFTGAEDAADEENFVNDGMDEFDAGDDAATAGGNTATAGVGASNNVGTATSAGNGGLTGGPGSIGQVTNPNTTPVTPNVANNAATNSTGMGSWLGSPKNALQTAMLANTGLSALQGILNPLPKENAAKNASQVFATNPGFNASLPKYTMNNTATPYTGNWYTYGFSPQQVQYNAQPTPAMKHGGMVPHYAGGGQVMPPQGGAPMMQPQAAPMQSPPMGGSPLAAAAPQGGMQGGMPPHNPLATNNGFAIGRAIAQHLKATGALNGVKTKSDAYRVGHTLGTKLNQAGAPPAAAPPTFAGDGKVIGPGGGQDDAVPAKLSQDEYVVPADVVAHLGDGSSNAGGKALDSMVKGVRVQKSGTGFPPKAKSPLAYIK